MRIADMNGRLVEANLQSDDRCVLPVGSVEQHAQLSLCVDAILSERVAVEAAGMAPCRSSRPWIDNLVHERHIAGSVRIARRNDVGRPGQGFCSCAVNRNDAV